MTVYFATFILTTLLVQAASVARMTLVRVMLGIAPVLIMSIVAGVRDFHVGGPDTAAYGNLVFYAASGVRSVRELGDGVRSVYAGGEQGYLVFNFLVSRLTGDVHVYYFLLSALVSGIVLGAIMLLRRYGSAGLMWLTYLCTAYVDSFNLLRQTPALALALLGVAITLRKRHWIGLAVGLTGLLFHSSAVVFVPMWLVAVYLGQERQRAGRRAVIVIAVASVVSVAGAPLIQLLAGLGGERFSAYLADGAVGGTAFALDTLYRLVPLATGLIAYRALGRAVSDTSLSGSRETFTEGGTLALTRMTRMTRTTRTTTHPLVSREAQRLVLLVVIALLAIELLLIPLREISYPLYRIPLYFGYVKIVAYAIIVNSIRVHRGIASIAMVAFVGAYFLLVVVTRNQGAYSSEILGVFP